jgi:prepilin-type N-terminal cleavage/methylation domain-containing protein
MFKFNKIKIFNINSRPKSALRLLKKSAGFTLVELLIVVSIIGLLSTLIVISVRDTRTKSFDTRRLSDINDIQKSVELYAADVGFYPVGTDLVLGEVNATCLSANGFAAICPAGGVKIYLAIVPPNPGPGGIPYNYNQTGAGNSFTLDFETETDIGDIMAGPHVLTPAGIQ